MTNLNGILLVDKPYGVTSHDVILELRKVLGIQKIGHAGTLDPIATGLLIILIGHSTKLSQHLIGLPKSYEGIMKLGSSTNTYDSEGEIAETRSVENVNLDEIIELSKRFTGEQLQIPPMFSAKKINGQKLYNLARKGKIIERQPVKINIMEFVIKELRESEIDFFVSCSSGMYVRTLVHDFGQSLGCGSYLCELKRLSIGEFSVIEAITIDKIKAMNLNDIKTRLIPDNYIFSEKFLNSPKNCKFLNFFENE